MKRFAILIDGSNFFESIRGLRMDFDYMKLLNFFDGDVVRAMYFTAVPEDKRIPSSIRPLLDKLELNGYKLVTKPTKEFYDDNGGRKTKGNMDMELAIAAIELAPFVSDIVLCTGDGDYCVLVEHLQSRYGVRVTCMSTVEPPMISGELRRIVDIYVDIADREVREELERNKK